MGNAVTHRTSALLDIELGVKAGSALSGRQPSTTPTERREFGVAIRQITTESDGAVRAFTGWEHAPPTPTPEVVARPAWIRANLEGISNLIGRLDLPVPSGSRLTAGLVPRAFAIQLGSVFGYASQKVLGQYDLFGGGRLLIVGPNMVRLERKAGVDQEDFRRWVILHELTHSLQFTAVPWLSEHLEGLLKRSIPRDAAEPGKILERVRAGLDEKRSLPEFLLTPEQRAMLDEAQALMSVIEGHASFVMNELGRDVIGDVDRLREQVEAAKGKTIGPERLVQRITGLDRKRAQYGLGEAFFKAIVAARGMEAMMKVWEDVQYLPSSEELELPELWLARVSL